MDNFQIETAQNISIRQNVAGIGDRILAFIVDSFILGVYLIISSFIIAGTGLDSAGEFVYYLILGVPLLLYYLLWESLWNGQTPGKKVLQLRVVKMDGSRPEFSNFVIRWLLRIIDVSISSGAVAVVSILLNGKGQRLGDIAAGTTVISEKKQISLENSLGVELPEDYKPLYPQVSMLKDIDIQEVKNLYRNALINGNNQIILMLSKKLAKLLDISPQQKPRDFVQQVISDYNYYTGR
ncbi:MAG TPA: RDD family protein [Salegentibacter sp.]|uniref:RDD family protein n=1 Tax=Salegentibacter sp. TaxID=1903072 RepID=UPI002F955D9A